MKSVEFLFFLLLKVTPYKSCSLQIRICNQSDFIFPKDSAFSSKDDNFTYLYWENDFNLENYFFVTYI